MNLISLRNINAGYDGKVVLENVNFDIRPQDFIGVIGPNGGGKTTLIKVILKLLPPYTGEVIYSREVEHDNVRRIGYLPQVSRTDKLFPISVEDVVLSGLQSRKGLWGRYTRSDRQKALKLLETAHIARLRHKTVGDLSGGEMQRALLCRALISDPAVLILDEPNTYVDSRFEKELYELLKTVNERVAILMVSHDIGTVTSYVKSIACVNHTLHYHPSNLITPELLEKYDCPLQIVTHGKIPHTVLPEH